MHSHGHLVNLPSTFKALVFKGPRKTEYVDISYDFDNLDENYVVITISAAGIGPYDLGFLTGRLTSPLTDYNLGCEGVGEVVKVGSNCDKSLLKTRVAFLVSYEDPKCVRAFSEFAVVNKDQVVPVPSNIDDYQAAYLLGNPMTAQYIRSTYLKSGEIKAVVIDTASSSLGKMLIKICKQLGIKMINIVRRADTVSIIEKQGSTHNLNSSDPEFLKHLQSMIDELNPSHYFSFQGGNLPSRVFDKMPYHSTMVCLGNINNQKLDGFSSTDFIFKGKNIEGFQLWNYLLSATKDEKDELLKGILGNLNSKDDLFHTDVRKEYRINQFEDALKDYESNMSAGKIIFRP